MNKRLQYGLIAAMLLTLVACGGGSSGKKDTPPPANSSAANSSVSSSAPASVASSVMSSVVSSVVSSATESSMAPSSVSSAMSSEAMSSVSSAQSSSANGGVSTTYTVNISAPQLGEGVTSRSWQEKLRNFFVSEAVADSDDVPLENLAVVIVDLAGNVIETIPLNDSNATQNADGSWSINVPGYPQLDCIVIANLGGPITLVSTNNIFDLYPNALFAPTTGENLDVDIASTAAYQNLLNELGGEGTFESLNLDVNDQSQLAVLENLISTVRQVIENQVFLGANNVAAALEQIQAQVVEIVQVEATNVNSAITSTLRDAMETGGGIHWYEAFEPQEIVHGAIVGQEAEVEYVFNGTEFEVMNDEYSSGDLLLGANGWVVSSDNFGVIATNEDGSVTIADMDVELDQINVKADQAFNLSGRNITEFFSAYTDTRAITAILNPASTFPEGSIGYRARMTSISTRHSLWYQPGDSEGVCPWDKDGDPEPELASEFGGNCETVNGWIFTEGQQVPQGSNALTTIASLKSADVAWNAAGSRLIGIGWFGGQSPEVVTVQLVDNAEKTAKYYLFNWNTNQATPIGQSTWAEITLPGLTGDAAAAITLNIPGTVEDQGVFNSDELKKLFAVHNGYVRTGHRYQAGDLSELGVLLINGTASDSVIAATNYKAPAVGSWLVESDEGEPSVLTFINNLQYTVTSTVEADCANGLETGYYQINGTSLTTDQEINVDEDCGLSSGIPYTIAVDGNSLSITEGQDVFNFTRLEGEGVLGTWIGMEPEDIGDHRIILSFLPENRFVLSQHGYSDIENGNDGYEYGTYTLDSETGAFVPTVTINRDGTWGFGDSEVTYTIATEGNDMTITVLEGEDEIVINLQRVTGAVN